MKFKDTEKDRLKRQLAREITTITKEIEALNWIKEKKMHAIEKLNGKKEKPGKKADVQ